MAKEDADASVTLIYAGKYQFQQSREQIPMEIRYTDRLYHYYETTLVLTDVRLAYVFCIRQQGITYYFCEDSVVLQYRFPRRDFTISSRCRTSTAMMYCRR